MGWASLLAVGALSVASFTAWTGFKAHGPGLGLKDFAIWSSQIHICSRSL